MAELPIIVLGAGGHATVVIDALKAAGARVQGITDLDSGTHGKRILGVPVLGTDDVILENPADGIVLVNGVGSTETSDARTKIYERFCGAGYAFRTVIHPSAIIAESAEISDGAQVMAGAVLQPACRIGANTIVNTRASVDHDCVIGAHVHVAPGAVLGGGVEVGDGVHIGAGATVIQRVKIGAGALVAAGAAVVSDVSPGARVAGVPARDM